MKSPTDTPTDPQADAQADALDAALRGLHREVLEQPLSPSLLEAAQRVGALRQQTTQARHWTGVALGLVLSFGVGWMSHDRLLEPHYAARGSQPAALVHAFVRQASLAHAVYLPEKRHPVEVVASEQAHLVQWLSKRLGKPLKIPELQSLGFELVGGRLLPGDSEGVGGVRAQFMFQNPQQQRVTLYLGAMANTSADAQATQFRFEPGNPVSSFYWAEQGFSYALSGQLDKPTLMALSDAVYQQLH
jgi:anti-sigma factor RsiW